MGLERDFQRWFSSDNDYKSRLNRDRPVFQCCRTAYYGKNDLSGKVSYME